MSTLIVVAIDNSAHGRGGPWAVAVRDTVSYQPRELFAPVLADRFDAEILAVVLESCDCGSTQEELRLAQQVERFVAAWNRRHGNDERYPTPDGLYPTARQMAESFLAEVIR